MHRYFISTPWFVKKFFPNYVWNIPTDEKIVYLSFDDGPHPDITPWVLEQLKMYDAKASFFCIGANVVEHENIYKQILEQEHVTGNHTFHHLNGWKTPDEIYLEDISKAAGLISSGLFRPPYGKIKTSQANKIDAAIRYKNPSVIMWDVLSGDFDRAFSPKQCFLNVAKNVKPGSIVVFHDSEKAFRNLEFALPASLKYLSEEGFRFEILQGNRQPETLLNN